MFSAGQGMKNEQDLVLAHSGECTIGISKHVSLIQDRLNTWQNQSTNYHRRTQVGKIDSEESLGGGDTSVLI